MELFLLAFKHSCSLCFYNVINLLLSKYIFYESKFVRHNLLKISHSIHREVTPQGLVGIHNFVNCSKVKGLNKIKFFRFSPMVDTLFMRTVSFCLKMSRSPADISSAA